MFFSGDFLARKVDVESIGISYQTLNDHLEKVGDYAGDFASNIGSKSVAKLAGLLHDIGKATRDFQNYLMKGGQRGSVPHSLQGAIFSLLHNFTPQTELLREILAMVIVSHHSGLSDGCDISGDEVFTDFIKRKDEAKLNYAEMLNNIDITVPNEVEELFIKAENEIAAVIQKIKSTYSNQASAFFALGLFVKFIYSCLIDADRLDAYIFGSDNAFKDTLPEWENLINVFETNIAKLSSCRDIDRIRGEISDKCKAAACKETGIYRLFVPTGGGKTFSSLRFALHHCNEKQKKRIIYVIPYLSIIEQTSKNIKSILDLGDNNDILFEHHSNIIPPDDEEEDNLRKLATERWDNPIIITTMVQFLESVMSARGSELRKFHNMSDSVIIFDEIQSLPVKAIHLFNEVVSFLSKMCNSTVLLCSATQPPLEKTVRKNLLLPPNPDLIGYDMNAFSRLNRTVVKVADIYNIDNLSNFVYALAAEKGNCLAILNTKKSARDAFIKISNLDTAKEFKIYHLSTAMCSKHRADIFEEINDGLKKKLKIICIATQLIEAGVDISFNSVVRAIAGLDSMAQAAGRCNRSGESIDPQPVYIAPLTDENLDKLNEIKIGRENTNRIIRENPEADLLDKVLIDKFYTYNFVQRKHEMDYTTGEGKFLYLMLSDNSYGKINYWNKYGKDCLVIISQAFRSADENFAVIDKFAESVIAQYGEAAGLIEKYKKLPKNIVTREKINIIRQLEKYSISLYGWEIENLSECGALDFLDEESHIRIINENFYDSKIGFCPKNISQNLIC